MGAGAQLLPKKMSFLHLEVMQNNGSTILFLNVDLEEFRQNNSVNRVVDLLFFWSIQYTQSDLTLLALLYHTITLMNYNVSS